MQFSKKNVSEAIGEKMGFFAGFMILSLMLFFVFSLSFYSLILAVLITIIGFVIRRWLL